MPLLKSWLFWLTAAGVFWIFALGLLHSVFPIYDDGYGRVATFYWGSRPTSDSQLLRPYWVAASVVTFLGCGATAWSVLRRKPWRLGPFQFSAATTFLALLLVGAIADSGVALHFWRGPMFYGAFDSVFAFLRVLVPMSIIAGMLAVARDRLNR